MYVDSKGTYMDWSKLLGLGTPDWTGTSYNKNLRGGSVDRNLYIKQDNDSILIIEFYVDDIIFGSDDDSLSQQFDKDMQKEFEM